MVVFAMERNALASVVRQSLTCQQGSGCVLLPRNSSSAGVVSGVTTTRHLFVWEAADRSISWRRGGGCGVACSHPSSSISLLACLVFSLDIAAVLARDPISCRNKLRRRGHGGRCVLLPGAGTPYVVQLRVRLRRFLLLGGGHVAAPV